MANQTHCVLGRIRLFGNTTSAENMIPVIQILNKIPKIMQVSKQKTLQQISNTLKQFHEAYNENQKLTPPVTEIIWTNNPIKDISGELGLIP